MPDSAPPKPLGPSHRAVHLWVPACLSLLALLAFFPLILRLSAAEYAAATSHSASPYLLRWLLLTAALFLASGLIYAARVLLGRRDLPPSDDVA